ncbi:MAG: diguanylate cyclase [Ruminococcus sp.]|nr:diguanylate cyclase [Ruminococcus sp.]
MKLRLKLSACIIAIAVLPLIILYMTAGSSLVSSMSDFQVSSLKTINADKSSFINEMLVNHVMNIRSIASDETVRSFAENGGDEAAAYTAELINQTVKKYDDITDMFIIDNSGIITAAYDRDKIGTKSDNSDYFKEMAAANNGISRFFTPKAAGEGYFFVVRRIYSAANKQIAIVCEEITLSKIDSVLNLSGFSNYASVLLIDSDGKYITSSLATPKALEAVAEYKEIGSRLKDAIPFYSENVSSETVTASYGNYTACGTVIDSAGWSLVCSYNKQTASSAISSDYSGMRTAAIILIIIASVGAILISFQYTHPIRKIIRVISNLNHGETNVRLDLNSHDEFGEISTAFNNMFDNMFESEQRYKTVVSMMDNVIFEINLKTYKIYVSSNFNQKFSFRAKDDSVNESFLYKMKVHKDDSKRYTDDLNAIISSGGEKWEGEYRLKNIYGDFSWIRIRGRKYYDRNKTPTKIIGMLVDIDREKKSAINLMQKANYDALTQLYNRASFTRTLDEEIQQSAIRRSLDALMFIDLDDFKHFNDEFGHKCGDEVLKFVADTIKELTFDKGFGGRLGGDEFVMCLTCLKVIDDAGNIAADMIKILNDGFDSESTGNHFVVHCSIGIAFFKESGENSKDLIEAADTAMYKIKKSGKSNYTYAGGFTDKSLDIFDLPDVR